MQLSTVPRHVLCIAPIYSQSPLKAAVHEHCRIFVRKHVQSPRSDCPLVSRALAARLRASSPSALFIYLCCVLCTALSVNSIPHKSLPPPLHEPRPLPEWMYPVRLYAAVHATQHSSDIFFRVAFCERRCCAFGLISCGDLIRSFFISLFAPPLHAQALFFNLPFANFCCSAFELHPLNFIPNINVSASIHTHHTLLLPAHCFPFTSFKRIPILLDWVPFLTSKCPLHLTSLDTLVA